MLKQKTYFRIIDANLNRLKEGIRVVEDILRYEFNEKNLVLELKNIRHLCRLENILEYIKNRDVQKDCLRDVSLTTEIQKASLEDIIISNFKRTQESARVLEEIFKLYDIKISEQFKQIRYKLYDVEKKALVTNATKTHS